MIEKKKILFITGYFPFLKGGAEYQAQLLAERLNQKMDVSFIFRNHWGKNKIIKDCGYTLYAIKPYPIKGVRGSFAFEGRQLNKILKMVKPDIIYVRGANAYFMIAALYSHKKDCKIVWHIASDPDVIPFHYKHLILKPFRFIEKKMVEYGLRYSDYIVGQTKYQSDLLRKNYGRRCDFVIGNWHPVANNFKKDNSVIKILWIANWKPIKQPEIFVQLVHELANVSNIQFIMIGRNKQYQKLTAQAIEAKIEVSGEISTSEVNTLLSKSHLLINTSRMEGFSNTFIQAWMNKVPVISLQVNPDNILEKYNIGLCSGNFRTLIQNTKRLIHDNNLREKMGADARKYAIRHHSLIQIEKMMKIFSN